MIQKTALFSDGYPQLVVFSSNTLKLKDAVDDLSAKVVAPSLPPSVAPSVAASVTASVAASVAAASNCYSVVHLIAFTLLNISLY